MKINIIIMKRFILLFISLSIGAYSFAQSSSKEEVREGFKTVTDSLTEEQKDALLSLTESVMLASIDSIMNAGRFMQALDLMDSIQVNWKYMTGREPSPRMYLSKGNILMHLEEWKELIKTTKECLSIHKSDIPDRIAAIMCGMQGHAHRNLEEYREAIRSYEDGAYYYTKTEDLGSQGDMFCSMAKCYGELGKHTMASSFYEKGINKFLDYFDTTKSALLRSEFYVKEPYKKAVLSVFAAHLFGLAIYEQDYGSRLDSKDYLLMSAHCGDTTAKSEYLRIYGNK